MKIHLLLVAGLLLNISACSVYKAREGGLSKVGYEEIQLEDGSYQLAYFGATSDSPDSVEKMWRRRAMELCLNNTYEALLKRDRWVFDAYTVLPPLFFKTEGRAPLVKGRLKCNI